jgi:tRNA1Val (adenine37-N6)-methyltransferase
LFQFKHFSINQEKAALKVGTDSMVFGALIDCSDKKNALDIGTGTGVLCLMLAQKNKNLQITGIEIDQETAFEALENCKNSVFSSQINIFHADFLKFDFQNHFDLIVSNPPFFENSFKSETLLKNFARHTDSLPFEDLFDKVSNLLSLNGEFLLILPSEISHKIIDIASEKSLFLNQEISIFGKVNQLKRKILIFSKSEKKIIKSELTIRDEFGNYTEEYKLLTKDYHNRNL